MNRMFRNVQARVHRFEESLSRGAWLSTEAESRPGRPYDLMGHGDDRPSDFWALSLPAIR
jgi:hypothetical protein